MKIELSNKTAMKAGARIAVAKTIAALISALAMIIAPIDGAQATDPGNWIATWTASSQPLWDGDFPLPTNVPFHLWNQTIRQVARVSIGGKRARVVLSNEYGSRPLVIGAAHIARAGSGPGIIAGSDRAVTFGGRGSVTIPPGAPVISDPVALSVAPLSNIAVTLFLPETTSLSTFHWDGLQTAYIAAGNLVGAEDIKTDTTVKARVFLSAILVDAPPGARAVVTFGDSITDGNGSTTDTNRRWPDFLAQRLAKDHVAVLNAGISGARVLKDRMGENALARFNRDVLSQPHVKTVVLLMGINDISWPGTAFAPHDRALSADDVIAGYRQLIAQAHTHKVRIVGATLTPFEGALQGTPLEGYYTADKEQVRQAVNKWMRTSGEFDAVIDFDAVTRDPKYPTRFLPAFDSGDHLHPGDAGNKAMADLIDLSVLFGYQ